MAEGASKFLFVCLLIVLTFFSSVVLPRKDNVHKDLKTEANLVFDKIPQRELLDHFHHKTILHDATYQPITPTFPTFTPTIITVPSTNPVTVNPNPASTPVPIPYPTTVPITNPVTTPSTAQPITNPVTTYPAPTTGVPVTTPVITGAPAVSRQSWCVAKIGAMESALQAALDYACGLGGAECSVVQEGGGCYNPNSLESHASYAFNSYYQKNPVQTSCDFGGTAVITSVNPSTGTCVYPSSLLSSSSPMTATTSPPTTASASSSGSTVPGSDSLPSVLNSSYPASGDSPPSYPSYNSSTSMATNSHLFVGFIMLVTSYIIGEVISSV